MTFKGTVESDFMKLVKDPQMLKSELIDYAGSDFDSIKQNLINYIKTVYPLDYDNFVESDLGIMLVELVSYVGAVTSMKADFLANENYIRTARTRNGVKKLLELIGIRLKGPISAVANATLTLETPLQPGETASIPADSRVVTISSPEDGEQVSYTLYKTVNGLIQVSNSQGFIELSYDESNGGTVFSNLILMEGALVTQTGTFTESAGIKFINLNASPVVEGSIEVVVINKANVEEIYEQVDNLFFVSGNSQKVFQVISDDNYGATVVFADSILADSPTPGENYSITYRVGGGTRGNLAKSTINYPVAISINSLPSNAVIENSTRATGGADAETVEHAKKYGPLAFRSQDRLVSLGDYNAFANSFSTSYGSVGKAVASTRRAYSSANIIDIFMLELANNLQLKKASPAFKKELLDAIEPKKMITNQVVVVDGLIRTLDLVISIRISREIKEDEEVIKAQVANIIQDYFNVSNREFGQEFIPQDLSRRIFELPSVIFATVDNYDMAVKVDFNEFIQLNNYTINVVRV